MSKFKIIKGKFHIQGYQPNGDKIRLADGTETRFDKLVEIVGFGCLRCRKTSFFIPKVDLF